MEKMEIGDEVYTIWFYHLSILINLLINPLLNKVIGWLEKTES